MGSVDGERTQHDLAGRSDRRVLPYGAWPSPVTVELAVGSSHGLGEPRPDGDSLHYLESRPEEAGRVALLRRAADGSVVELAPGLNVRTRVHEYGGGAHAVRDGVVVLSEFEGNRLLVADTPDAGLRTLVDEPSLRFADMELDLPRRRVIAVLEDQRDSAARPRNVLCAVGLDDGSLVELAADHDFCSDPRISPDGAQLAWLTWDFPNMPWDGSDLWVAPLAGDGRLGDPVHAAGGPAESVAQPRWAPDGSLVFASDRTGWWNLHRWRTGPAEGSASVEPLAPMSAEFAGPQWVFGLSDFDIDEDGTIAAAANAAGGQRLVVLRPGQAPRFLALPFESLDGLRLLDGQLTLVAGSPVRPSAIIRVDVGSGAWERLVESRTLDLEAGFLSHPEHITFPSAAGRTAHAWYYPPTNASAHGPSGELPPLVVMSHGGPTSQARTTLSLERQAFTSRGLAVVDVDYGGSTGYGRAYRELLHESWGIVDVEDCVAAARYLVAQGLVDARRLAIRGGSAGGYTTLAALCFSDAFSAGVSYYGLGDLAGFAAITHKFESQYDRWLIGPADDGQRYRERSPNHHAARISCPVLVLQGADDRIVPPAQAEGIVAALRANGLPHAYLLFEGEGHGFRKAENQRRALEAELSFYAQVFGFELADAIEPLPIVGLPR